ncbi:hypothetical protein GGH94_003127 [Coemansia aciculifera]|uniref:Bud22 domain-containing protein n=1 Tax=Coemansia aciculifera TaxID=417176 RepID=A0A9W8IR15_9FUNG|nr:hypothetical protein GGH94_003127 [Coemansia aciculifera]KAJ2874043.1 hypothetical protein GGH93_002730 [Coemansia aciculifera]
MADTTPEPVLSVDTPTVAEAPVLAKRRVHKAEWRAKQREQRSKRTKAKKAALQAKREALGLKAGDPQPEDAVCVKIFKDQLPPEKAHKLRRKLHVIRAETKTKVKKATGFEIQRITRKLKRIRTGKPKAGEHESDVPELESRLEKVKAIKQDALIECVVHRIKKQSEVIRGMLNGVVEPSEDVQKHLDDKLSRHLINHLSITNTVKKHVLDLEGVITEKNKKPYKLQKKEERKLALKSRSEAKERAKQRKSAGSKDKAEPKDVADKADAESDSDSSSSSSSSLSSSSDSDSDSDSDVGVNSDVDVDGDMNSDAVSDDDCGYESTSDLDAEVSDKKKGKKVSSKSKREIKSSTFVGQLGDFVSDDALSASDSDEDSSSDDDDRDAKRKRKDKSGKGEKSKKRKSGNNDDEYEYDEKADNDFKKLYEGVERKNRPGQRARRQKFEQVYGKEANHIKLLTKDKKPRDKPKRLSPTSDAATPKPAAAAAANTTEQMHPSWEAKRRQKEILAQAKEVKGTKIVFD